MTIQPHITKKRSILLGICVAAVVGVALWAIFGEPRYKWKSLSAWLNTYGSGPHDYKPSSKADDALRHIGPKAVPYLLELLRETNSSSGLRFSRKTSILLTNIYGNLGGGLTTNIVKVRTGSLGIQTKWMMLLEKYTPLRVERVVTIRASWKHWKAYLGFQALGPAGKAAIPELVKLAHEPGPESSYPNIESMKKIEVVASSAASDLNYELSFHFRRFLTNHFLVDVEIAAWSLAAIGADAVPALIDLLADPNPRLKARAAQALGMAGAPAEPAVPALTKTLKDPLLDVRIRAADALGWIEKRPDLTVPVLIEALTDHEIKVVLCATESLGRFRQRASNAIPALLGNFASTDDRIKRSAAIAVGKISREATEKKVLPALILDIKHPLANVRAAAVLTLGQMRDQPDLVIPALIEALYDSNPSVRTIAITMLGRFGPDAKAAVPKLVSLRTTWDSTERGYIDTALAKIDPEKQWGR